MRYKVLLTNLKKYDLARFKIDVQINLTQKKNLDIPFTHIDHNYFFKKNIKLNFIKNLNFLTKNFFLKNSTVLFKFSYNTNKMYQITTFHIKQFNFSKRLQKTYSQTMTNLF